MGRVTMMTISMSAGEIASVEIVPFVSGEEFRVGDCGTLFFREKAERGSHARAIASGYWKEVIVEELSDDC